MEQINQKELDALKTNGLAREGIKGTTKEKTE